MEKEYYIGYLRNPKDIITNGFQDIKEMEVVVIREDYNFREATTRGKIFVSEGVFDGHLFFQTDSRFFGRIGKKITREEACDKLKEIRNIKEEFANTLTVLSNDTFELAIRGEKEYINTVEKFVKTFRK